MGYTGYKGYKALRGISSSHSHSLTITNNGGGLAAYTPYTPYTYYTPYSPYTFEYQHGCLCVEAPSGGNFITESVKVSMKTKS